MLLPLRPVMSIHWLPAIKMKKYSDGWGAVYDDANAIFDLAQLAGLGLADRIQKCRCDAWFFARFKHQRFCSARCREAEFRSSEEWKEYRRNKAREYYRLHRTKNIK
jgi:hypothetical protein